MMRKDQKRKVELRVFKKKWKSILLLSLKIVGCTCNFELVHKLVDEQKIDLKLFKLSIYCLNDIWH